MTDKTTLRKSLIAARRAIDPALRQQWDAAIGRQVMDWCLRHEIGTCAVYWPIQGEPDLRPMYAQLSARGIRLALPVVVAKEAPLRFVLYAPGDALVKDGMGCSVPAVRDDAVLPDAVLIPCVGFNHARYRLGYGGGFYDRTLALTPRPLAIGVAHSISRADFAIEPHDIALDALITDLPEA
ncbi:MAG: 5-formyltetrahydrofolate cyclo-ligase [Pseudomonadota bacterium]